MKRSWILAGGIFSCLLFAAVIIVFAIKGSRVVTISEIKSHGAGTTTSTTTATSTLNTQNDPHADPSTNPSDGTIPSYPYPVAITTFDQASYNAKLLAIAHIPVITKKIVVTSTLPSGLVTSTITYATTTAASQWPVTTAAYPAQGALLPFNRIVAYYGNLYSTQMGVLGQYPAPRVLAMLASTTAMWQAADPSTPVIPALDYIAVTAQASPGSDGKYRLRMPASQIDQILSMANQIHGIVFLDLQVGGSNVETEVPLLEQFLKLPQVELSLDPEFDMHNGSRPGSVIGTMDASDINWAANYLANLVQQYNLPPKILVVHRFTQAMVTNTKAIKPLSTVQIVMDMDGFGSPAKKLTTYTDFIAGEPVQFTGFKLFYKNDASPTIGGHLMTPEEVLKLSPQPSYIQYQ